MIYLCFLFPCQVSNEKFIDKHFFVVLLLLFKVMFKVIVSNSKLFQVSRLKKIKEIFLCRTHNLLSFVFSLFPHRVNHENIFFRLIFFLLHKKFSESISFFFKAEKKNSEYRHNENFLCENQTNLPKKNYFWLVSSGEHNKFE